MALSPICIQPHNPISRVVGYGGGMQPALRPSPSSSFDELYKQLQSLPEGMTGQIIDGQLYAMTRPFSPHATAHTRLVMALAAIDGEPGDGHPGGWRVHLEPEIHLVLPEQTHAVVPDLAAWRISRLTAFPKTGYLQLSPDWVCEVLSEGTASLDVGPKRRLYHRAGVEWLWFIDPIKHTLEAQRQVGDVWVRVGMWQDQDRARIEPFPEIEINIGRLWEGVEAS